MHPQIPDFQILSKPYINGKLIYAATLMTGFVLQGLKRVDAYVFEAAALLLLLLDPLVSVGQQLSLVVVLVVCLLEQVCLCVCLLLQTQELPSQHGLSGKIDYRAV